MIRESRQGIVSIKLGKAASKYTDGSSRAIRLERELTSYLKGRRRTFSRFPMDLTHLTPFTQKVLREVLKIGFGKRRTYSEIAKRIGHPHANRAVGSALGKNPLPLLIPCHRVGPVSGKIGGFYFGTRLKEKLLKLEGSKN